MTSLIKFCSGSKPSHPSPGVGLAKLADDANSLRPWQYSHVLPAQVTHNNHLNYIHVTANPTCVNLVKPLTVFVE